MLEDLIPAEALERVYVTHDAKLDVMSLLSSKDFFADNNRTRDSATCNNPPTLKEENS